MRTFAWFVFLCLSFAKIAGSSEAPRGVLLENLTWLEAEQVLTEDQVVVIPLGAAAKEHGPHLKLNNDFLIAEYLKQRVLERSSTVIAPTVNYHFFPAFLDYPGSVSLRKETARDLIVDICRITEQLWAAALLCLEHRRIYAGTPERSFRITQR